MRTRPISTKRKLLVGEDGVRREPLGSPVEWVEEESYFFQLCPPIRTSLLALYADLPDFVLPRESAQ